MENGVRFSMGWDLVMPGVKEENPPPSGLLDLSRPPRSRPGLRTSAHARTPRLVEAAPVLKAS